MSQSEDYWRDRFETAESDWDFAREEARKARDHARSVMRSHDALTHTLRTLTAEMRQLKLDKANLLSMNIGMHKELLLLKNRHPKRLKGAYADAAKRR